MQNCLFAVLVPRLVVVVALGRVLIKEITGTAAERGLVPQTWIRLLILT